MDGENADMVASKLAASLMTLTEAAQELGVTRQRVHAMIKEGKLDAVKVGTGWLVSVHSVHEFELSRKEKQ